MSEGYASETAHLFQLLCCTGQRIGEALTTKREDCTIEQGEGQEVLVVNSSTEKNRAMPFRVLPCAINTKLTKDLAEWINNHERGKLFNGSRQSAGHDISKRGKALFQVKALVPHDNPATNKKQWAIEEINYLMHPHYLRHCCLTHKVIRDHLDLTRLMQFAGWSTPTPALIYIHLDWRELLGGKT